MAKSPTSCGISCAVTATAVVMPSGSEVMAAAAITAPSTKLWNASPTTTGSTAPSCTSQSWVWQWRQSTSFSRTKNSRMPSSSVANTCGGASCSSAFGRISSIDAPSSAPTA